MRLYDKNYFNSASLIQLSMITIITTFTLIVGICKLYKRIITLILLFKITMCILSKLNSNPNIMFDKYYFY